MVELFKDLILAFDFLFADRAQYLDGNLFTITLISALEDLWIPASPYFLMDYIVIDVSKINSSITPIWVQFHCMIATPLDPYWD